MSHPETVAPAAEARAAILDGRTALGIELGSTRIKACLIGTDGGVLAVGGHEWENELVDGLWTYSLDAVRDGLRAAYAELASDAERRLVWGWRIPFLFSALLIVVGLVIRLKVAESPVFERLEAEAAERTQRRRIPLTRVLTGHPRVVILTLVASLGFYACQGILTSWGVSEATTAGVAREAVLNIQGLAAVVTIVVSFAAARLSDRIGRRTVLTIGGVLGVLWAFPALVLLHDGTAWGFAVAVVVGNGLIQGILAGPIGAYISEQFPPAVRYTGASLAYQGASTLGAGFTPMIATALMVAGGLGAVAGFWIAVLVLGLIAVRLSREGAVLTPRA
jgi:MFS family permease